MKRGVMPGLKLETTVRPGEIYSIRGPRSDSTSAYGFCHRGTEAQSHTLVHLCDSVPLWQAVHSTEIRSKLKTEG
jgi:hypothetical protein